ARSMTTIVAAGRRHLPRGWGDLGLQFAIWFGFLGLYQLARGIADRNPTQAFENGLGVIRVEERVGDLFELTVANLVSGSHVLIVGISLALVCRHWWARALWMMWPAWVWFAVMATGNHFWLDILAGIVVALIAALIVYRRPILRRLRPAPSPA